MVEGPRRAQSHSRQQGFLRPLLLLYDGEVPIPSDCGCAEAVGTPLLRLPPPLGDTSPAPARLDADGDGAELQFADSVARYSHADWRREHQGEQTCHAAMRYITLGRPSTLPADFLSCLLWIIFGDTLASGRGSASRR